MHDPHDPVLDPMIDPRTGEYAVIAPGHNFRSVTQKIAERCAETTLNSRDKGPAQELFPLTR